MLFKNKRRVIIALTVVLMILLYVTRALSILIPFTITVISLLLFHYIDKSFKFNFPERFYIYVFIIFILGTVIGVGDPPFGLYYRIQYFDKILHFVSPFLMTSIMFFMLDRLGIAMKWKSLMAVGLEFGILGLFEIGEYLSDKLFGTLWQGVYIWDFVLKIKGDTLLHAIDDTMQDLIFGLLGSGLYTGFINLFKYFKKH